MEEQEEIQGENEIEKKVQKFSYQKKPNYFDKLKKNPWMISTIVLGIIVVILLVGGFGGITGNVISEDFAGEKILDFASSQGADADLVKINDKGNLYEVVLLMEGSEFPVYITKDGNYFISQPVPLTVLNSQTPTQQTQTPTSENIPKSDKPKVELFVMSYCPYGTQAEKGILPVVALLDDKIDFKLRTVHYILHGEKEDIENKRELCIREEQGQDKLNRYLVCILDSDDINVPADVVSCEKEAGIDSAKLQTCLTTNADDYYAADSELSEGYGVRGSPTLIINGVESRAGRSPASYLSGICDAFNNAPEECNEQLSLSTPSAGFGYNEGTDTIAQC